MQCAPVRFYLNDTLCELHDVAPTRTVLQFLREDRALTGTKEGCAEGDCGACTVVLGEAVQGEAMQGEAVPVMRYRAINSCITFVPALHGKQLITVDAIGRAGLHPVQQAMVAHHASQCGFCTPGFVMSLYALYQHTRQCGERDMSRDKVTAALSGNLCRCTGYRPILDAAATMTAGAWVAPDEPRMRAQLQALAHAAGVEHVSAEGSFIAPRSLDELLRARAAAPAARLVGGTTDVGLWVTKQHRELTTLIYTGQVRELLTVAADTAGLTIGAAVPLTDAFAHLSALYPSTRDYWQRFASPPVRNSGTLGGNIANGSPIGDSMPVLIALGAEVVLASVRGERTLALEDFYLGYQQTALAADEVLRAVRVPAPLPQQCVRAYKLSKRFDQDISALALGIALLLDGDLVRSVRIGVGGMAATPRRARAVEQALTGRRFDAAALQAAQAALADEFSPIDDMRASAGYRRTAAQNLLRRAWLDTSPLAPALPAITLAQVSAAQVST